MKILVTGSAGFIGYHTVLRLLERGDDVVGIDNLNDYYDVRLKFGRLNECGVHPEEAAEWSAEATSARYPNYRFLRLDLADRWADTSDLEKTFGYKPATPVREGIGRFVRWYRDFYGE